MTITPAIIPFEADDREIVKAAFECDDPIDVQLALLERFHGGSLSFDVVDELFIAHGWRWPE